MMRVVIAIVLLLASDYAPVPSAPANTSGRSSAARPDEVW